MGISESSLKRWSDRGVLPVIRTAGGHRRIALADAIDFLRTSQAPVVHPEILGFTCGLSPGNVELSEAREHLHESLRTGDRGHATAIVLRAWVGGCDVAAICDDLLRPVMNQMGDEWQRGETTVYQEHRASQICAGIINELRRFIAPPPRGAAVAFGGAPSGDPYCLGSMMCEVALLVHGWRAAHLGPDLPIAQLLAAAEREKAQLVWLSLGACERTNGLAAEVGGLCAACDRLGIRLLVGGRGLDLLPAGSVPPGKAGRSIADLCRVAGEKQPKAGAIEPPDLVGL